MIKIAMIEDDLELANVLSSYLKQFNIQVVNFEEPFLALSSLKLEKFDLIICFPVLGGRWLYEGEDFISKDPALIAAQNLLYHISMNGKLCIIMPAKVTFGSGDSQVFRSYINDNYKINDFSSAHVFLLSAIHNRICLLELSFIMHIQKDEDGFM